MVVFDEVTKAWIPGAQITLDEQPAPLDTDTQGSATVTVRPGLSRVRLTVSHPIYETKDFLVDIFPGMGVARVPLKKQGGS